MTTGDREHIHAITEDMWRAFGWLCAQPTFGAGRAEAAAGLRDEAQIIDMMSRYGYSHDAKDTPWTMSLFTEDCVSGRVGTERYTKGNAAVGKLFDRWNQFHHFSRHRVTNHLVRFFGPDQAWVAAYWHASRTGHPGEVEGQFGRYLWRVVRQRNTWLIADRIVEVDLASAYEDEATVAARPQPDWRGVDPAGARVGAALKASPEGGRASFDTLAGDLWAADGWLFDGDTPASLDRLVAEHHVRGLMSNYAFGLDAGDMDRLGSVLADDIRLSGAVTANGKKAAVAALQKARGTYARSFHRFSNPVARVAANGDAWIGAFLLATIVGHADERRTQYGRYFARATKADAGWRIADCRVSFDAQAPLTASYNFSQAKRAAAAGGGSR